jgi:hypothetical protein
MHGLSETPRAWRWRQGALLLLLLGALGAFFYVAFPLAPSLVLFVALGFAITQSSLLQEFLLSILTIGLLVGLYLQNTQPAPERAKVAEAVELLASLRTPLALFYSETGTWPGAEARAAWSAGVSGKYTNQVQVEAEGVLRADLLDHRYILNFRPARSGPEDKLLLWVCGTALPPPGLSLTAPNATNLPAAYLPDACR